MKQQVISKLYKVTLFLSLFIIAFFAFWPEPLFYDYTAWIRNRNGGYVLSIHGEALMTNMGVSFFLLLSFVGGIMGSLGLLLTFKYGINLGYKRKLTEALTVFLPMFLGLVCGLGFYGIMGETLYQDQNNKLSRTYVDDANYRREFAKFIGADSFLGIDLTFPSNRGTKQYDIRKINEYQNETQIEQDREARRLQKSIDSYKK